MAVVRERLQTHHPEELRQCYYRNSSTCKTEIKALSNSLIAKLQSIAYLFPFYLCTRCTYDRRKERPELKL